MSITEIYEQAVRPLSVAEQVKLAALILNRLTPETDAPATDDPARTAAVPAAEATMRALQFYDARLRPMLEPGQNGRYVAIHPETQEYAVERGPGRAYRAMRTRQPQGSIVLHHIGPADAALRARLRGEHAS